jgi:hypothetical protein
MVSAASRYPLIREFSTTANYVVSLNGRVRQFNNTNALVSSPDWQIGVSKTGFINESGKCLVMQAWLLNKPMIIVLLDSFGRFTRVADAQRVKRWLESAAVQQKVAAAVRTRPPDRALHEKKGARGALLFCLVQRISGADVAQRLRSRRRSRGSGGPVGVEALGRGGQGQARHQLAAVVPDAGRDAAHAVLHLVEVVGDAVAANLVELLFEGLERGDRGGGGGGQAGAPGVVLDLLGPSSTRNSLPVAVVCSGARAPTMCTTRTAERPLEVRST